MADEPRHDPTAGTVEAFLVALADSVANAQRTINSQTVKDTAGQPAVTYQLPKLDFEFRTSFELNHQENVLQMRSVSHTANAQSTSRVAGSFVAVPTQGGKPPPIVSVTLRKATARAYGIEVQVNTADGQPQAEALVEFNIDRERSAFSLADGTRLRDPTVLTDKTGKALTGLDLDNNESSGNRIFVVIDVLDQTQTVIFQAEEKP